MLCLAILLWMSGSARSHDGIPPYPAPLRAAWEAVCPSPEVRYSRPPGRRAAARDYLDTARNLLGTTPAPGARTAGSREPSARSETASDAALRAWVWAALGGAFGRGTWIQAAGDALDDVTQRPADQASVRPGDGFASLAIILTFETLKDNAPPVRREHWRAQLETWSLSLPVAPGPDELVNPQAIAAAWLRREMGLSAVPATDIELDGALAGWRKRFAPSGICDAPASNPDALHVADLEARLGLAFLLEGGYAGAHRYYFEEMLTRGARTTCLRASAAGTTGRHARDAGEVGVALLEAALRCAVLEWRALSCVRSDDLAEARAMRAAAGEALRVVRKGAKASTGRIDRAARYRVAAALAIAWRFAHESTSKETSKLGSTSRGRDSKPEGIR